MRHSLRLDHVEGSSWDDKHIRPYDTPIRCQELPREQANKLLELPFKINKVYSSPFRRCLQTAAIVCKQLGVNEITIHKELGETMTCIRSANSIHVANAAEHSLDYLSLEDSHAAIREIWNELRITESIGQKPDYHESRENSHSRFVKVGHHFRKLLLENSERNIEHVLLVTHADGVISIGESLSGHNLVEVKECGFVVLDTQQVDQHLPVLVVDGIRLLQSAV